MIKYLKKIQERMANKGDEGFTLIELLIVIVVLGILAAVVVFALGNVNHSAKSSACSSDAKTVETAVSAYNAQNTPAITVESTTGNDVITMTSTAGIVVGQTVADVTHPGTTTPVVAITDATHLTVAAGATSGYTNGDTISVNAVSKGAATFTPAGIITLGTPSTYASAGTQAAKLIAGNYLRSWPAGASSSGYAISLSTTTAGNVTVYIPVTSASGVDFENQTSANGCNNALL